MAQSVGVHLALWYASMFIVSSILLFGLTYVFLSSSLRKQDHATVQERLEELSAVFRTGGVEALQGLMRTEKKFGKTDQLFVRLGAPEHKTVVLILPYQWVDISLDRITTIPPSDILTWRHIPLGRGGYRLDVASRSLGARYVLQVGKSDEERERILRRFRGIFAGAVVPLLLFGFAGGVVIASRALYPIRGLIKTVRSVDSGDMGARVPTRGTGDELDELATLFNQMLSKIARLITGMKESLDNVAHDLRSPLSRMRGTAEMALQSEQDHDALREALGECMEESEQILRLLNTLMDISEAEAGTLRLRPEKVILFELIDQVVDVYKYVAEEKGITIAIQCPKGLSTHADRDRMRQVIANLLDNALKFTPEGGRVTVRAERSAERVVLAVQDTGCGIPQEALPMIWDRLYRWDQSRSQRGMGLGLSLVKAIVEAHGGSVEVSSEPGQGSTFRIGLPMTQNPSVPATLR
jgi:signal transduction histidine kinase